MYIERKFAEAMFLITGLMSCLVMTVLLTAPAQVVEENNKLILDKKQIHLIMKDSNSYQNTLN